MLSGYLLSVVIPTRNRVKYAAQCVRQVLRCGGGKIQVVVQDNSSVPSLREEISDLLSDSCLVYHYTETPLSFVDNFDQGLRLADGEYVTIIGDDDGITSELYRAAEWAKRRQLEAVKPNANLVYFWPDSKALDASQDKGRLIVNSSSAGLRWADTREGVRQLLKNACQGYLDCDLVKIYHGLVSKETLERVRKATGRYVGGLSPDIYLSVALSLVTTRKIAVLDIPLTISGICVGSGSSQSATGEHTGTLESAPHFQGHDSYAWKEEVPRFYSVETIWADSALAAVADFAPELRTVFSIGTFTYKTFWKYKNFQDIIWSCYTRRGGSRFRYAGVCVAETAKRIEKSLRYRLGTHKRDVLECPDIAAASALCEQMLSRDYARMRESFV